MFTLSVTQNNVKRKELTFDRKHFKIAAILSPLSSIIQ
jgi:hypothetical protein